MYIKKNVYFRKKGGKTGPFFGTVLVGPIHVYIKTTKMKKRKKGGRRSAALLKCGIRLQVLYTYT